MRDIFEIRDNFSLNADVESILQYGNPENIKDPKVTIIVPCYNHPKYLKKALLSAVNQDYQEPYEIIVVDNDDSSEYTQNRKIVEEVNSPKILYYHNKKNIGGLGIWNRGVELARAPYVTYCHDDDMLLSNCLSILMFYQSKNGDKGIWGLRNYIDQDDHITYKTEYKRKGIFKPKKYIHYTIKHYFNNPTGFCVGSLFSRKKMIELGGYDVEFCPISDAAFSGLYTLRHGAILPLEPTHNYRFAENDTFNVYNEISKVSKHFRKCAQKYINCPKIILNLITEADTSVLNYHLQLSMNPNKDSIKKPALWKLTVSRLSSLLVNLGKYTIV